MRKSTAIVLFCMVMTIGCSINSTGTSSNSIPDENSASEEPDRVNSSSREQRSVDEEVPNADVRMNAVKNGKINVQVSIEEQTADHFTFKVKNEGPAELTFGKDYYFQEKKAGKWKRIPLTLTFESIGYELSAGEFYRQNVYLKDLGLAKGKYRVVKPLKAKNQNSSVKVAAEFSVE
ncbi:hypothetical protein Q7A53_08760 [Halobacillus rhizosphaerae]|uniref:immunoglobulin-like domain-containing protein n=1 Tax=Halobacillus rhizosphaerae TaxID=3064889 RepID=UPI00398ADA11